MSSKFSSEEDEILIDIVREHPALYQVKSRSIKDNVVKNNIWKKISETLGKNGKYLSIHNFKDEKDKCVMYKKDLKFFKWNIYDRWLMTPASRNLSHIKIGN